MRGPVVLLHPGCLIGVIKGGQAASECDPALPPVPPCTRVSIPDSRPTDTAALPHFPVLLFPGRTEAQCFHRWQKVLNPDVCKGPWTKEARDGGAAGMGGGWGVAAGPVLRFC